MPRFHNINGTKVQFTQAEETARDVKEQIWEDGKFDREIADLRQQRNSLLSATDFYALQDVSMSQDMTNYRQALRDLPEGLSTVEEVQAVTFPTKP
jgi:SMC interacting uncharacterized protein involved in chromosome segregation|tara:strand:- start:7 stop:294 length:288 start_codon:yes stop_codon:yes gene_type:complete